MRMYEYTAILLPCAIIYNITFYACQVYIFIDNTLEHIHILCIYYMYLYTL